MMEYEIPDVPLEPRTDHAGLASEIHNTTRANSSVRPSAYPATRDRKAIHIPEEENPR